ncbi:hypothetical protein SYNPS1DRAFT_28852 [Syncephalis pseudoplumigaleata]|uniref:Uncharacterized protein n=1 Tax=Syncephalis pseudoplumigaleata TaxID=1712513 RepID=A0A4P9YZN4_9FUNG|nr:hypothetical protein SYNPS1DRAFT_28852 [Syncephalis pseudoplumigaleata]|eukprot:RKP25415.1 hypothetical protein SYNPS1DRAFT_28852 [Syncephalis pseudoplumigaleata]
MGYTSPLLSIDDVCITNQSSRVLIKQNIASLEKVDTTNRQPSKLVRRTTATTTAAAAAAATAATAKEEKGKDAPVASASGTGKKKGIGRQGSTGDSWTIGMILCRLLSAKEGGASSKRKLEWTAVKRKWLPKRFTMKRQEKLHPDLAYIHNIMNKALEESDARRRSVALARECTVDAGAAAEDRRCLGGCAGSNAEGPARRCSRHDAVSASGDCFVRGTRPCQRHPAGRGRGRLCGALSATAGRWSDEGRRLSHTGQVGALPPASHRPISATSIRMAVRPH